MRSWRSGRRNGPSSASEATTATSAGPFRGATGSDRSLSQSVLPWPEKVFTHSSLALAEPLLVRPPDRELGGVRQGVVRRGGGFQQHFRVSFLVSFTLKGLELGCVNSTRGPRGGVHATHHTPSLLTYLVPRGWVGVHEFYLRQ